MAQELSTLVSTGSVYFNSARTSYYKGQWKEDTKHGRGEIVYGSGNTYIGEWNEDLKQGDGVMEWKARQRVLSRPTLDATARSLCPCVLCAL